MAANTGYINQIDDEYIITSSNATWFDPTAGEVDVRIDVTEQAAAGAGEKTMINISDGASADSLSISYYNTKASRILVSTNGTTWGLISDTVANVWPGNGNRLQSRWHYDGSTTLTFYTRDPATYDLELNDDTNWTQAGQDTTFDMSTMFTVARPMAFHADIAQTADQGGVFRLYEFYVKVNGTIVAHIDTDCDLSTEPFADAAPTPITWDFVPGIGSYSFTQGVGDCGVSAGGAACGLKLNHPNMGQEVRSGK